jgi:DNA-binding transcriptional ArsR family regulator
VPILPADVAVQMPDLPARLPVNTLEQFKAISDPLRTKILGIVQQQPATAKQIAERLGATPGAIGHHLHVLEDAGLVQVVARRLLRGIVANYYTRTARLFVYDLPPEVAGQMTGAAQLDMALEIINTARNEMADALTNRSPEEWEADNAFQALPHVRLSPDKAEQYAQRLQALLDDLLAETPDPNGKVYGILLALYPAPAYVQSQPSREE